MEKIVADLHDPSWWFTACFIGLLIGVISGALSARFERGLASVSEWYRIRTAPRRAARAKAIEVLVEHPQLLAIAFLDAIVGMAILAVISVIVIAFKNMLDAPVPTPPVAPALPETLQLVVTPTTSSGTLLISLVTLVIVVAAYFVSRRLTLAQEAWRKLSDAKGLPKF